MEQWYHYFVYMMTLSLLANCIPVPDATPSQKNETTNDLNVLDLFEGDIRLKREITKRNSEPSTQNFTTNANASNTIKFLNLWPNNTIYYKVDNIPRTYINIFREAIKQWQAKTCLTFINLGDDSTQQAYLNFTTKLGCSSFVGRTGQMQEVSIYSGCSQIGFAIHEIGHALGLWHEHTREDRDKYVNIIWDNIKPEFRHNFALNPSAPTKIQYDFESIMHYRTDAFAKKDRMETIDVIYHPFPKCLNGQVGQRDYISFKDALKVNTMYGCTDKLESKEVDPCPLPSPQPIPEPTSTSTIMSTPTSSTVITSSPTPTAKPCTFTKALQSGDAIRLSFSESSLSNVGCPGSCSRRNCSARFSRLRTCDDQYFVIYLASNRKNPFIKNGDTIALKSLKRAKYWMDCSRDNCSLTKCRDLDPATDIKNYVKDICEEHKFEIHAVNRNDNGRIRLGDTVYLKAKNSDKYLNCIGKRCTMITEGNNCGELYNSGSSGYLCSKQQYVVDKHNSCND